MPSWGCQDGDLDLVTSKGGNLQYWLNTATKSSMAVYSLQDPDGGDLGPFNGLSNCGGASSMIYPAIGDFNHDGIPDLLCGSGGVLTYLIVVKNVARRALSWPSGNTLFVSQTNKQHPLNGVSVGNQAQPTVVDIDNDGDLVDYLPTLPILPSPLPPHPSPSGRLCGLGAAGGDVL
jgi:hypothetical protein